MGKSRKRRGRTKSRDNNRRIKKRVSILTSEKIEYVDWKDYALLRKFISDRAKIRSRRVTGNNTQQQKLVACAVKLAREMALLPYSSRVTTQRQHKEHEGVRSPPAGPGTGSPQPSSNPPPDAGQAEQSPPRAADTKTEDVRPPASSSASRNPPAKPRRPSEADRTGSRGSGGGRAGRRETEGGNRGTPEAS